MAGRIVGLDVGNFDVKVVSSDATAHFRHIFARVANATAKAMMRDGELKQGMISVNGEFYMLGEPAKRMVTSTILGTGRYVKNYYDVLMCAALSEVFEPSNRVVAVDLSATIAPKDYKLFAKRLVNVAGGDYEVATSKGRYLFSVKSVSPIDEPLAGYGNLLFTGIGQVSKLGKQYEASDMLIVDIGGFTTDFAPIDAGGSVDYSSLASVEMGVYDLIEGVQAEMKATYPDKFFNAGNHELSVGKMEGILLSGHWQYGKSKIDVSGIVEAHFNILVNNIVERVNSYGGAGEFQVIGLTGGGGALLRDALKAVLPDFDFVLMAKPDAMRYANASGAYRILKAEAVI